MGALDQNPKKPLELQTKKQTKNIPGPEFNPPKTHAKFRSHKNFLEAETVAKQVWFYTLFPEEPKKLLRSSLSLEIHSNASPTTHPATTPLPLPLSGLQNLRNEGKGRGEMI